MSVQSRDQTPFDLCFSYFEFLSIQKLYLNFIEKHLKDELKIIESEIGKIPKDERFGHDIINFKNILKNDFTDLLCKSNFVILFGSFEKTLKEFCKIAEIEFNLDKLDTKSQDLLKTMYDYLKKKVNIRIEENEKIWNELNLFKQLRNNFIHNLGEDYSSDRKQKLFLPAVQKFEKYKMIKKEKYDVTYKIINIEFNLKFQKTASIYLEFIEQLLREKYLTK